MTKKFIIITTIFPPTPAVKKFVQQPGHSLIVVGDRKTPVNWHLPGCHYLSLKDQTALKFSIVEKLRYDHYSRKMIGYLFAISNGADVIIDTDDDNMPKSTWAFPDFEGEFNETSGDLGFINIYRYYTGKRIWPRGYPLRKVDGDIRDLKKGIHLRHSIVGVWQGLADGAPDVDAVYRLIDNRPCTFHNAGPVVLGKGTISPFNSQNTAIRRELFPLLYLPASVTFRFTDILRSYIAQPIMWVKGYSLGFTDATVIQERNEHDLMKDFESEIPMYLNSEKIIRLVTAAIDERLTISENLISAYKVLAGNDIVRHEEIDLVRRWLSDIAVYTPC